VRYLILSDIHSNWEALEAVLAEAEGEYDDIVCCGDIVGYGADPNATTNWVWDNVRMVVRGNHDKAAVGSESIEWFNSVAKAATLWTQAELSEPNMSYLANLAEGPLEVGGFQLVHGSPLDEDDYILTPGNASQLFGYLASAVTFFGHSHLQGGFVVHRDGAETIERVPDDRTETQLALTDGCAHLINPGSVGQPRDRDPRAAYAIYDDSGRVVHYRRTFYDIESAQRKIVSAGLPDVLATRLSYGS